MSQDQHDATDADKPSGEPVGSTGSGKYAIVVIALLAIGGALFNWIYQRELHRRSLELWGPEVSRLIVKAPRVEAWRLAPADGSTGVGQTQPVETVDIDGRQWQIVERRTIDTPAQAPGSSHVRRSLVNDRSFDWDAKLDDCQPSWQFALQFREGETSQIIALDLHCPRVQLVGTNARASIKPVVPALMEFFGEQFPRAVSR